MRTPSLCLLLLVLMAHCAAWAQAPCDSNVLAKKIIYDISFTDKLYSGSTPSYFFVYFPEKKQLVAALLDEIKAGRLDIYFDMELKNRVPKSKIDSVLNPLPYTDYTGLTKQLNVSPDRVEGIDFWEQWFHNGKGQMEKKVIAYGIFFSHTISGADEDDVKTIYTAPGFFISGSSSISLSLNFSIQNECDINQGVFGNMPEIDWYNKNIEPSYRRPFTQYFLENVSAGKIPIYKDAACTNNITWQDVVRKVKQNPALTLDPQKEWWEYGVFSSYFVDMQFNETWTLGKNGFTKTVHNFGFTYMVDTEKRLVLNLFWVKNGQ